MNSSPKTSSTVPSPETCTSHISRLEELSRIHEEYAARAAVMSAIHLDLDNVRKPITAHTGEPITPRAYTHELDALDERLEAMITELEGDVPPTPEELLAEKLADMTARAAAHTPDFTRRYEANPTLEPLSLVVIPGTTEPFVAKDRFVANTNKNAPTYDPHASVRIGYAGNNFTTWFLTDPALTEPPQDPQVLEGHRLRTDANATEILTALGRTPIPTTLATLWHLLSLQGRGQAGLLHIDGKGNIFHIKDSSGVLREVYVYWDDNGWWYVGARSVESPHGWYGAADNQVFSRNSDLEG